MPQVLAMVNVHAHTPVPSLLFTVIIVTDVTDTSNMTCIVQLNQTMLPISRIWDLFCCQTQRDKYCIPWGDTVICLSVDEQF